MDDNGTVNAPSDSGPEDNDGANEQHSQGCHLFPHCPVLVDDAGDSACYAVDVHNWFSLLPMETTPVEDPSVEEFPAKLVSKPIIKATKSKVGLNNPESSGVNASSSSEIPLASVVEEKEVETKEQVNHYIEGI